MKRYMIELINDLHCVFKWDVSDHGWRMAVAFETKKEAENWIKEKGARYE